MAFTISKLFTSLSGKQRERVSLEGVDANNNDVTSWNGDPAGTVNIGNINIPNDALVYGLVNGGSTDSYYQIAAGGNITEQIQGGAGTPEPIIAKTGLPSGKKHMLVEILQTHSQLITTQSAFAIFAAVNEGSVANYKTLFTAPDYLDSEATAYSGSEELGFQVAMAGRPAYIEQDADIDDFGVAFAHSRGGASVSTNEVYGHVYIW